MPEVFFSPLRDSPSRIRRSILSPPTRKKPLAPRVVKNAFNDTNLASWLFLVHVAKPVLTQFDNFHHSQCRCNSKTNFVQKLSWQNLSSDFAADNHPIIQMDGWMDDLYLNKSLIFGLIAFPLHKSPCTKYDIKCIEFVYLFIHGLSMETNWYLSVS